MHFQCATLVYSEISVELHWCAHARFSSRVRVYCFTNLPCSNTSTATMVALLSVA
jgi:hypothetical protein